MGLLDRVKEINNSNKKKAEETSSAYSASGGSGLMDRINQINQQKKQDEDEKNTYGVTSSALQKRIDNLFNSYKNDNYADYFDTSTWKDKSTYDGLVGRITGYQKEAQSILDDINTNRTAYTSMFGTEAIDSTIESLNSFLSDDYNKTLEYAKDASDIYGQYDNAEDYSKAYELSKKSSKYLDDTDDYYSLADKIEHQKEIKAGAARRGKDTSTYDDAIDFLTNYQNSEQMINTMTDEDIHKNNLESGKTTFDQDKEDAYYLAYYNSSDYSISDDPKLYEKYKDVDMDNLIESYRSQYGDDVADAIKDSDYATINDLIPASSKSSSIAYYYNEDGQNKAMKWADLDYERKVGKAYQNVQKDNSALSAYNTLNDYNDISKMEDYLYGNSTDSFTDEEYQKLAKSIDSKYGTHFSEYGFGQLKYEAERGDTTASNDLESLKNRFDTDKLNKDLKDKYGYEYDDLKYYQDLQDSKAERAETLANTKKFATEHPILATITAAPASLFNGVDYVNDLISSFGHSNEKDSSYRPLNFNDNYTSNYVEDVQATVSEDIYEACINAGASEFWAKTAASTYGGVSSGLNSLTTTIGCTALFGGAGATVASIIMSGGAASNAVKQAVNNGSTTNEALATGLLYGINEYLGEKYSLELFISNFLEGGIKDFTFKEIMTNLGKVAVQSGVEGSEEAFTEFLNTFADTIINGDHSSFNTNVNLYVASGMTEAEARRKATVDWLMNVAEQTYGGAIGGLMMAGPTHVVQVGAAGVKAGINNVYQGIQTRRFGEDFINNYGQDGVSNLVNIANGLNNDSLTKDIAKVNKYSDKLDTRKGQKAVGSLVNNTLGETFASNTAKQIDVKTKAIEKQLVKLGVEEDTASKYAKTIFEVVTGQIDDTSNDYQEVIKNEAATSLMVELADEDMSIEELSPEAKAIVAEANEVNKESDNAVANIFSDGKSKVIEGDNVNVRQNADNSYSVVRKDGTQASEDMMLSLALNDKLDNSTETLSANAISIIANNYDGRNANDYVDHMFSLYNLGNINGSLEDAAAIADMYNLDPTAASSMYMAGNQDYYDAKEKADTKIKEASDKAKAEKGQAYREAKIDKSAIKDITLNNKQKAQIEIVDKVASSLGVDIVYYNQTGADYESEGYIQGNTIHLNIAAHGLDKAADFLSNNSREIILQTFSHELTHFVKTWSPSAWNDLKDFCVREYAKEGNIRNAIEAEKDRAAKMGMKYSNDQALDEFVAYACSHMLDDEKAIKKLAQRNKSLYEKIAEHFENFAERLYLAIENSNTGSLEERVFSNLYEAEEKQRELWTNAVLEASNRYNNLTTEQKIDDEIKYSNLSAEDSNGNKLSKQQREYFKDTKVVDEDNNLLEVYRGDSNEVYTFDKKKSKSSNLFGRGFYFTNSKSHASQYGNATSYYLNITNPLSTTEHTISKTEMRKFIAVLADEYGIENYGEYATVDTVLKDVWNENKTDFNMIRDLDITCVGDLVETTNLLNKTIGSSYDGFILPTEMVTFESNQAKKTDNKNPTFNDDTRYSNLSAEENVKKAKEEFGTTKNPYKAGYIVTDGSMLDFSNENNRLGWDEDFYNEYGSPDGEFNEKFANHVDHDFINDIYNGETDDAIAEFLSEGNMRMYMEDGNALFQMAKGVNPTSEILNTLKSNISKAVKDNLTITIDIYDDNSNYIKFNPNDSTYNADNIYDQATKIFNGVKVNDSVVQQFHVRYSNLGANAEKILMGSMFSGGGTLESGLVYKMMDKEFAVEYNEKIANVYMDNHGKEHMFVGDVRDFDASKKKNVFYLHVSPSCVDYSSQSNTNGETTTDITTATAAAKALQEQMPQVFTCENVKQYIGSEAYTIITDKLDELGYKWDVNVYKAADYGNATKRERMIIRAVKDGELPAKPKKVESKTSWAEATRDLWNTELTESYLVKSKLDAIKNTKALKDIDIYNQDKALLIYDTTKSKTITYAWEDQLCPTLTTKCGDARIILNGKVYKPSPVFMGRLQGLPDNYKYPSQTTTAYRIIGNGIPTQLTQAVMGSVIENQYQAKTGNKMYSNLGGFNMKGDGNGYDGYSMSNNARDAYENGEKPLSKWSKSDIISAIKEINPDKADMLSKLNLKTLKDRLLIKSSWHHTSSMYNRTDFYSLNEDLLDNVDEEMINNWSNDVEEKTESNTYRGDINYIEWTGTKRRPKANLKSYTDVNIEERGSFYIVTDDNGNELIRKKIGSNGTKVINYAVEEEKNRLRQEREERERIAKEEKEKAIKEFSSKEALKLYNEWDHKEYSRSGHVYKFPEKPSSYEYDENLIPEGRVRLAPNEKGGYNTEVWNGVKWVDNDIRYSNLSAEDRINSLVGKIEQSINDVNNLTDEELDESVRNLGVLNSLAYKGYGNLTDSQMNTNNTIYSLKKEALIKFANEFAKRGKEVANTSSVLYFRLKNGIQISFHKQSDSLHNLGNDYINIKRDNSYKWDGISNAFAYTNPEEYQEKVLQFKKSEQLTEQTIAEINEEIYDYMSKYNRMEKYGIAKYSNNNAKDIYMPLRNGDEIFKHLFNTNKSNISRYVSQRVNAALQEKGLDFKYDAANYKLVEKNPKDVDNSIRYSKLSDDAIAMWKNKDGKIVTKADLKYQKAVDAMKSYTKEEQHMMELEINNLNKQNAKLEADLQNLTDYVMLQKKITNGKLFDIKSVRSFTNKVTEEITRDTLRYKDRMDIADDIKDLYEYIAKTYGDEKTNIVWDDVASRIVPILNSIYEATPEIRTWDQQAKEMLEEMKATSLVITEEQIKSSPDGTWKSVRDALRPYFKQVVRATNKSYTEHMNNFITLDNLHTNLELIKPSIDSDIVSNVGALIDMITGPTGLINQYSIDESFSRQKEQEYAMIVADLMSEQGLNLEEANDRASMYMFNRDANKILDGYYETSRVKTIADQYKEQYDKLVDNHDKSVKQEAKEQAAIEVAKWREKQKKKENLDKLLRIKEQIISGMNNPNENNYIPAPKFAEGIKNLLDIITVRPNEFNASKAEIKAMLEETGVDADVADNYASLIKALVENRIEPKAKKVQKMFEDGDAAMVYNQYKNALQQTQTFQNYEAKELKARKQIAEMQRLWQKENISENEDMREFDDIAADMQEELDNLEKFISNRNLNELNSADLQEVYDHVASIKRMLRSSSHQLGVFKGQSNEVAAASLLKESRNSKSLGSEMGIARYVNPIRATRTFTRGDENSHFYKYVDSMNKGLRDANYWKMKAKTEVDALKNERSKYNDFVNNVIDTGIKCTNGETLKVTKAMMVEALMAWDREMANPDSLQHIRGGENSNSGGLVFPDIKLYQKGKYKDSINETHQQKVQFERTGISPEELMTSANSYFADVMNTFRELTNDEYSKRWEQAARTFFNNRSREAINLTMLKLGKKVVALEDNYIPFTIDKDFVGVQLDGIKYDGTLLSAGFLKDLIKKAPQPIVMSGIDNVVDKHADYVAKIYGLTIPIRDFQKAYNVNFGDTSVQKSMKSDANSTYNTIITQLISDLQNSRSKVAESERKAHTLLQNVESLWVKATLSANISVSMKQAASYFVAGDYVSNAALMKAFKDLPNYAAHATEWYNEIDEHTAQHYIRRQGLTIPELQGINSFISKKLDAKDMPNSIRNIADYYKWIQAIDVGTTALIWQACKYDVEANTDLKVGSEEYWNAVTTKYDDAIENTQPMYDPMHRPESAKDTNAVHRMIYKFKTQPLQNFGIMYDRVNAMKFAQEDLRNAIRSNDTKAIEEAKAKKNLAAGNFMKAAGTQATSLLVFATMTFAAQMIMGKRKRYRDEEEYMNIWSVIQRIGLDAAESAITTFVPFAIVGDALSSLAETGVDAVKNGKLKFDSSKDLISAPTIDLANEIWNNLGSAYNAISNGDWSTFLDIMQDLAGQAATVGAGIPFNNIKNIVMGGYQNAKDLINGVNSGSDFDTKDGVKNALSSGRMEDANERADNYIANKSAEYESKGIDSVKAQEKAESDLRKSLNGDYKSGYKGEYLKALWSGDTNTIRAIESTLESLQIGYDEKDVFSSWEKEYYDNCTTYLTYEDYVTAKKNS